MPDFWAKGHFDDRVYSEKERHNMTIYSLAEESPLRHLPRDLDPDQTFFLEGIRQCIDMAFLAYSRLCGTLGRISRSDDGPDASLDRTSAFLDAWSVVDMIHRLRELVQQMPRMKQKAPGLRVFLIQTQAAEELRNIAQHLRNEAHAMAENGDLAFGTLAWVSTVLSKELTVRSCILMSGIVRSGSTSFVAPHGKQVRGDADLVVLRCKATEFSLTESIDALARFVRGLERSAASHFEGLPTRGTYLLAQVEVVSSEGT